MAQLSLGESKWRMLRRVIRKRRFRYEDTRNQTRHDQAHFDWLLKNGFLAEVGDGSFELTEKGKDAADLGFYEFESRPLPPTDTPAMRGKRR